MLLLHLMPFFTQQMKKKEETKWNGILFLFILLCSINAVFSYFLCIHFFFFSFSSFIHFFLIYIFFVSYETIEGKKRRRRNKIPFNIIAFNLKILSFLMQQHFSFFLFLWLGIISFLYLASFFYNFHLFIYFFLLSSHLFFISSFFLLIK